MHPLSRSAKRRCRLALGRAIRLLALASLLLPCIPATEAAILIGARGRADDLIRIDTDTLQMEVIGDTNSGEIAGLTFAPDGTLFGIDARSDRLRRINLETGSSSHFGPTGPPVGPTSALATNPLDGFLYGVSDVIGGQDDFVNITRYNPATGVGTIVSTVNYAFIPSMTFDESGTLWAIGIDTTGVNQRHLITINPETGSHRRVSPSGYSLPNGSGLVEGPDGNFFYIRNFTNAGWDLYTVDRDTGIGTLLGPLTGLPSPQSITGLVALPPVPEPQSGLLVLISATALWVGASRRRRVRR